MKIEGKIDIFINREETTIIVHCAKSNATICEITLTPEQLSSALSRLSLTPCKVEYYDVNNSKIGKEHYNKELEFELPEDYDSMRIDKNGILHETALKNCPEGWVPDNYYGSQTSFFSRDGKRFARTTIRTWI